MYARTWHLFVRYRHCIEERRSLFTHSPLSVSQIPEDFQHLSPERQQRAIKLRALWMLSLGTFVVLLFSDPMVRQAVDGRAGGLACFWLHPTYLIFCLQYTRT
jgi:hypothetical protein